mmetsp:Transcript_133632/g.236524  ORF Transcript_133632/g.236524 Transcript_133632/m.236524 type:complete len:619 (+) Transcript_133632:103-1959(+)
MITYDSHEWRTFIRIHGSVFPQAIMYALPATIMALVLKILDENGMLEISKWQLLKQSGAWGMFTGTVGFLLVFRTGQCYSRFLNCAHSIYGMRTQMHEAYAGLVAFCCMSKASAKDQSVFQDKLIHLFSTLHACALASICGTQHHLFTITDIEHMPSRFIQYLKEVENHERVELSYQWINNLIVKEIASGLLNVPPPILSRVFQAMEKSMVEYNTVVMLMTVPFPFPYSQACIILMFVHVIALPFIVVSWTGQPAAAAILTFLSSCCFMSLEMISAELENPFGDDANDLAITDFHDHFNNSLQLLMHPSLKEDIVLKRHRASDLFRTACTKQLDDYEAGHAFEDYKKGVSHYVMEIGDESHSGESSSEGNRADQSEDNDKPGKVTSKPPSSGDEQEKSGEEDEHVVQTEARAEQAEGNVQESAGQDAAAAPPAEAAPSPKAQVQIEGPPELPAAQIAPGSTDLTNHLQVMTSALLQLPWMSQFQERQTKFEEDMLRRLDEVVSELRKAREAPRQQEAFLDSVVERLGSSRPGSATGSKRPSVESQKTGSRKASPRQALQNELWAVPRAPKSPSGQHRSESPSRKQVHRDWHEIPWPSVTKTKKTPVCKCCVGDEVDLT